MAASLGRHFPRIVGCCVALFIAFGGSAYAKHPFGKNTINSRDVIDDIAEERRHQKQVDREYRHQEQPGRLTAGASPETSGLTISPAALAAIVMLALTLGAALGAALALRVSHRLGGRMAVS